MKNNIKLSLIVPCYNEEDNIEPFVNNVNRVFKNTNYEIIFINDGSQDNTLINMKKITSQKNIKIKIISFSRNFGKEAGMYAGIKHASGELISIIDADLQQKPEYVLDMVNYLDKNKEVDMVVAYQEERKEIFYLSWIKKLFYKMINHFSEVDFVASASDFRTFRRNVKDAILQLNEYYRFSKGLFSYVGFNSYYMPYKVEPRFSGKTKWSLRGLFKYAMNGIVSFTPAPLKIATFIGAILSFFSIIYLIIIIIQKFFFDVAFPGFATIVTLIVLLSGIQLICIGMIGEYLSRTYIESKNRPIYVVKEYIDNTK